MQHIGTEKMKNILLRGSWQTKNIGDIAHTPGFLNLAGQFLPECRVWLWPCELDRGVREMILKNFPGLRIAESDAELAEAFKECDLLVNGSGPCVDCANIRTWVERTHKPYGLFGVSVDGLWDERKKAVLSDAAFVFCRDSLSEYFLKQQDLQCPVIGFTSDSTFGMRLDADPAGDRFLKENSLEPEKYVCVIPRLRFTPDSFDEDRFYYKDPVREAASMGKVESDMAKMRDVIRHIVENYDLKVLICPEMTYQVPMGRRYLYERLPGAVKEKVVLKREYWITSEAESVYSKSKALVSMEMHSPIIFIDEHKPAILLRQAEDTWKGQMWRDIGLQEWILELNVTDSPQIDSCVDRILQNYPAALEQAAAASRLAIDFNRKAMEKIRAILAKI